MIHAQIDEIAMNDCPLFVNTAFHTFLLLLATGPTL